MEDLKKFFVDNAKELNIDLTKEQIEKFFLYKNLLLEWNQKMNLTAIKEDKEIILKHFIDSISVLNYLPDEKNLKLIDIGTGAGFPGIPLKIMRDNIDITLFDSLNKRLIFLNEVIEKLDLINIATVHGRAEDFAQKPQFREVYDVAIARAVANLPVLLEYCLPFVKIGGVFIAMKSEYKNEVKESQKALKTLGGKIEFVNSFMLDGQKRAIIIIKKISKTPISYPRRAGIPTREPLRD